MWAATLCLDMFGPKSQLSQLIVCSSEVVKANWLVQQIATIWPLSKVHLLLWPLEDLAMGSQVLLFKRWGGLDQLELVKNFVLDHFILQNRRYWSLSMFWQNWNLRCIGLGSNCCVFLWAFWPQRWSSRQISGFERTGLAMAKIWVAGFRWIHKSCPSFAGNIHCFWGQ